MSMAETPQVNDKDALLGVLFSLLDENDAIPWKNDSAYRYLAALAHWLHDHEVENPTWQMLAEALTDATGGYGYE